jgi:hypothetical protein
MDGRAMLAIEARENDVGGCGPRAKFFEPKPPGKPSLWARLDSVLRMPLW